MKAKKELNFFEMASLFRDEILEIRQKIGIEPRDCNCSSIFDCDKPRSIPDRKNCDCFNCVSNPNCNCKNCDCKKPWDCSKPGCFITTAVCQKRNLPDDCEELTVLRHFRDTYMNQSEELKKQVSEYYMYAPVICEIVDKMKNNGEIYNSIYEKWIIDAVNAVRKSDNELAYDIYKDMFITLKNIFLDENNYGYN